MTDALSPSLSTGAGTCGTQPQYPQLAGCFKRLHDGDHVTVCYLGGSITFGACATDPLKTSYRALVTHFLEEHYPTAHIKAVDAAIGGTGSRLGVFRMDRDVLPYHPDLTFIEFAVNDDAAADTAETMEGIIRKLHKSNPEMAIVIITIGAGWEYQVTPASRQHQALAAHYGLPLIDVGTHVAEQVARGLACTQVLEDGCHPNDAGYRLYTSIITDALPRLSAAQGTPGTGFPAPMTCNRYESAAMLAFANCSSLGDWQPVAPSLAGTWFDHTPSRWLSSAIAPMKDEATLQLTLACRGVGLYYELQRAGSLLHLHADGQTILDITTDMPFDYSRVASEFKMGDELKTRTITLLADTREHTQVGYLLYTQ